MEEDLRVESVYEAVDALDVKAYLSFLTEDCEFRAGNSPPAVGRAEVGRVVSGVFSGLTAIRHRVENVWRHPGVIVIEGEATYFRRGAGEVTLPFVDVFRMQGSSIKTYLIYGDLTPLQA